MGIATEKEMNLESADAIILVQASSHIVDAFTVRKKVEKRVRELKAELNDGARND